MSRIQACTHCIRCCSAGPSDKREPSGRRDGHHSSLTGTRCLPKRWTPWRQKLSPVIVVAATTRGRTQLARGVSAARHFAQLELASDLGRPVRLDPPYWLRRTSYLCELWRFGSARARGMQLSMCAISGRTRRKPERSVEAETGTDLQTLEGDNALLQRKARLHVHGLISHYRNACEVRFQTI